MTETWSIYGMYTSYHEIVTVEQRRRVLIKTNTHTSPVRLEELMDDLCRAVYHSYFYQDVKFIQRRSSSLC